MQTTANINDVLDGHVALDLSCVDRLLLNAYVPTLQSSGQVFAFMRDPGEARSLTGGDEPDRQPVPAQREGVRRGRGIPILHLKKPDRSRWDDRKLTMRLCRPGRTQSRFGVVAIVSTQEFQFVFSGKDRSSDPGRPWFEFVVSSAGWVPTTSTSTTRVRSRLHQDRDLLPLPGQSLVERP